MLLDSSLGHQVADTKHSIPNIKKFNLREESPESLITGIVSKGITTLSSGINHRKCTLLLETMYLNKETVEGNNRLPTTTLLELVERQVLGEKNPGNRGETIPMATNSRIVNPNNMSNHLADR